MMQIADRGLQLQRVISSGLAQHDIWWFVKDTDYEADNPNRRAQLAAVRVISLPQP